MSDYGQKKQVAACLRPGAEGPDYPHRAGSAYRHPAVSQVPVAKGHPRGRSDGTPSIGPESEERAEHPMFPGRNLPRYVAMSTWTALRNTARARRFMKRLKGGPFGGTQGAA